MIEPGDLAPTESTPADYGNAARVGHFAINDGLPLLKVQQEVFECAAGTIGCFGSWRSGKTRGGSLKIVQTAAENPWRPVYKSDNPTSMVITETVKVIRDSAYRELMQLIPEELILKKWTSPSNWRLRLVNGHDIIFRPWSGKIEGLSGIGIWIDEAHKLDGPDGPEGLWQNFAMRATDPRATRRTMIATGLPEYGYLSEKFDKPNTKDRATFLCSLKDNFYLDEETIIRLRASTTEEEAAVVIDGKWRKPQTVVYYAFGDYNLTDFAGDQRLPADLSIDLGDKGAILVSQRITKTCIDNTGRRYKSAGVVVVDEVLPDRMSVKEALRDFVATKPWNVRGSLSRIYVDPKADRDEMDAIREILNAGGEHGPRIVKRYQKEKGFYVEYGHRCVNSAFRDLDGNHRLYITRGLPRGPRSLIPALRQHRRKPNGEPLRDNIVDHVLDCLRYIVVDQLPLREGGRVHISQRAA